MKNAIKVGFGFAFGVALYKLCDKIACDVIDRCLKKKFDADPEFRVQVKTVSPELYIRYRKESKDATDE